MTDIIVNCVEANPYITDLQISPDFQAHQKLDGVGPVDIRPSTD